MPPHGSPVWSPRGGPVHCNHRGGGRVGATHSPLRGRKVGRKKRKAEEVVMSDDDTGPVVVLFVVFPRVVM